MDQRARRLFTVDGVQIDSEEINTRLADLTGAHLTAKDFRTWKGTTTAFRHLRRYLPGGNDAEQHLLAAIDAAALKLNNTRSVARAHYVHPDVVDGYTSGALAEFLAGRRMRATKYLDVEERLLLAYLSHCLDERAGNLGLELAAVS
jgi:DNA topoisomerase-1